MAPINQPHSHPSLITYWFMSLLSLFQESWRAALLRASGQKVLDDPKLLRKSLKKEAKRKEKSSKGWQERVQAQEEKKAAKQNK